MSLLSPFSSHALSSIAFVSFHFSPFLSHTPSIPLTLLSLFKAPVHILSLKQCVFLLFCHYFHPFPFSLVFIFILILHPSLPLSFPFFFCSHSPSSSSKHKVWPQKTLALLQLHFSLPTIIME